MKTITKILSLVLATLSLTVGLTACGKKDEPTVDATRVVGTVDGKNVYYDELYFLANTYKNATTSAEELDRLIRENITANYAILALCEEKGMEINQRSLEKSVDSEQQTFIVQNFGGDKDAYRESMAQYGLTERYHRYTLGVDLLYGDLSVLYPELGLISDNEEELRQKFEDTFIHVYHIAVFYNEENQAEQYAKICEAREKLTSGQMSMYDLIGSSYNEDVSDFSGNGFYIARGTMDVAYENAAFALEMREVSEIVDTQGTDYFGNSSSCYYLIQRFELDENYIDTHFNKLQDEYYNSIIYADMQAIRATLSFSPNEFYTTLDLLNLPKPEESSSSWVVILIIAIGLALVVGAVIWVIVLKNKKKKLTQKAISGGSHERS